MYRRLFVAVLVAALTLAVAPRAASGLGGGEARPRGDAPFRCMYRCVDRADSNAVRPNWERGDGWSRPARGDSWDRWHGPRWSYRQERWERRGWWDRRD